MTDTAPHIPPAPDLACPLCAYNLRGLTEPRCPECGHTFEWAELTDPARQKLHWLFEHRRYLAGYLSTQFALLRPWKFWKTLRPSHRLVIPRLLSLTTLSVLLSLALVVLLIFLFIMISLSYDHLLEQGFMTRPPAGLSSLQLQQWQTTLPALKAAAIAQYPTFGQPGFFGEVLSEIQSIYLSRVVVQFAVVAVALLTPALSALSILGIMRQSFARAKIRPGHVFRVAFYSGDPAGLLLLPLLVALLVSLTLIFHPGSQDPQPSTLFLIYGCFLALWQLRLYSAIRNYLTIPRPWSVCLATFLVGVLGFMTAAFLITG